MTKNTARSTKILHFFHKLWGGGLPQALRIGVGGGRFGGWEVGWVVSSPPPPNRTYEPRSSGRQTHPKVRRLEGPVRSSICTFGTGIFFHRQAGHLCAASLSGRQMSDLPATVSGTPSVRWPCWFSTKMRRRRPKSITE